MSIRCPGLFALLLAACPPSTAMGLQDSEQVPAPERGLSLSDEGAFQGYTLLAPLGGKTVYLIDMQGEPVHQWELEFETTGTVELLPDGHLLQLGVENENERFHGPGVSGGLIQKVAWDGQVAWRYSISDDFGLSHHDFELLPNGNVLVIIMEHVPQSDAVALGRDPRFVDSRGLWMDGLVELRPIPPDDAEIVWEWHAYDHLVQDFNPEAAGYGVIADHPGRLDLNVDHRNQAPLSQEEIDALEELGEQMAALGYGSDNEEEEETQQGDFPDWLHTNAVAHHPELDLLVLSSAHLSEIFVLDHSTTTIEAASDAGGRFDRGGELLWRWGNPRNHGAGGEQDQRLAYQHDPTFVAGETPGELRLLVFNNNGGSATGDASAVDELVLPFDPERGFLREGRTFGPDQLAWRYSHPESFHSSFISGAQRLPNGNTLVCEGSNGRLFEVTREGRVVWEFLNPYERGATEMKYPGPALAVYRAYRLAPDHPGLKGRILE